ncbi:HTH-type transcriptional regulator Hpr [Staphylococcus hyicus]|uniref:HTH-type transcriptional regulator Hpr n=2 Tax=Staphylococcus hyicus TaxID=1284 RepID=A0ACD5FMW9_STAHY|nr:HTH-type transcriptional regulator Hpr [Staphylococcus hyicus]AJC95860.1 HTH-type transcriptional regulator Hpr [Staphylococcus hyicus]MCE5154513.1 HTH-type transcriptional regulator Hpr [Staphylococcus hyicus]MCQ9291130.1 HTH-type transcriptional regulator Hpr [Staphylococcus hyicus]MCQ9299588.1 HTH-type transcriptional regulator Hpr [Staphylococcus hyicus]MCQ9306371.1 HTH-type transcriptional regulator Hpr [Staphylococcus hyicus]
MTDKQKQIESILFTHKAAMLSKVIWKNAERDWQNWLRKSGITMNEHLILMTIYAFGRVTISDISRYGVMHVSTAYNFAKRLEQQGLLTLEKDTNDKRNTYIHLTDNGKKLIEEIFEQYNIDNNTVYQASEQFSEEMFHKPNFSDAHYLVAKMHGKDFIDDVNACHNHLRKHLLDVE